MRTQLSVALLLALAMAVVAIDSESRRCFPNEDLGLPFGGSFRAKLRLSYREVTSVPTSCTHAHTRARSHGLHCTVRETKAIGD